MTDYIQGPTKVKANFILSQGAEVAAIGGNLNSLADVPEGKKMVIVVDNGMFEAAAVVEDQRDFDAFLDRSDFRPKTVLFVPDHVVSNLLSQHHNPYATRF